MKISLCMIVKNEEALLKRALQSVLGIVDEIVIVDTGSTDGTLDIARKYGAVIDVIPWTGFADARNRSMDMATGDRIFILDADEYIERGHEYIIDAAKQPDFICGVCRILNQVKSGVVVGETNQQMRLFRNVPEIRYEYAVHNQIEDSVYAYHKKFYEENGRAGILAAIDTEIVHTGYDLSEKDVVSKYTPRLDLLYREIEEADSAGNESYGAYYRFQLALMLHMVRRADDATALWDSLDYTKLNVINRWYAHYTAARAFMRIDEHEKALMHCDGMYYAETLQGAAKEAASHMITGVVYLKNGERKKGLKFMIQAYLDNLQPQFGTRCILNRRQLLEDIARSCEGADKNELLALVKREDIGKTVQVLRRIQRGLVDIPKPVVKLLKDYGIAA